MLHTLAITSLIISVACVLIIAGDIILAGNRQQMMVMNFVYPITALYGGIFALLFYYKIGRNKPYMNMDNGNMQKPFWHSVAKGALHCGSGCTLGDICAEFLLFYIPVVIFGSKLAGTWTIDFVFAFFIGIIFQYYAIKPMGKLSSADALKAALKADTLSLTSWQLGMYGWMAICFFVIFKHKLEPTDPIFWFMMQVAMLFGFATAFPVNWWLIKKGIKEAM